MKISKLRNMAGRESKGKFTSVSFAQCITEGNILAGNGSFVAVANENNGAYVLDINNSCTVGAYCKYLRGHDRSIVDLAFSPFKPNLLATGGEDAKINLWEIPEGGIKEFMNDPIQKYFEHTKKIVKMAFHPCCSEILGSASMDNTVQIWDITKSEALHKVTLPDNPANLDWIENGSLIGCGTKQKKGYIIDPRSDSSVQEFNGLPGNKPNKLLFLDDQKVILTGNNKTGARAFAIYDRSKLDAPLKVVDVDKISLNVKPFIDRGNKILYFTSVSGTTLHMYDLSEIDNIRVISPYATSSVVVGYYMLERRFVNYNRNELAKFIYLNQQRELNILDLYLPRRVEGYEPEFYKMVTCGEPSVTIDEWKTGTDRDPIYKEINQIENKFVTEPMKFEKKEAPAKPLTEKEIIAKLEKELAEVKSERDKLKNQPQSEKADPELENKVNELTKQLEEVMAMNEKYVSSINEQEAKIAALEEENTKLKDELEKYLCPQENQGQEEQPAEHNEE